LGGFSEAHKYLGGPKLNWHPFLDSGGLITPIGRVQKVNKVTLETSRSRPSFKDFGPFKTGSLSWDFRNKYCIPKIRLEKGPLKTNIFSKILDSEAGVDELESIFDSEIAYHCSLTQSAAALVQRTDERLLRPVE